MVEAVTLIAKVARNASVLTEQALHRLLVYHQKPDTNFHEPKNEFTHLHNEPSATITRMGTRDTGLDKY